jgi:tetratricopeptide (TPR) repeat protein
VKELRDRLQSSLGDAYILERELGGGGMSRIFVAHESALGRRVVVKVLPPELAAGVSVERFKREIQMAARLQHPHIVPVLSAGEAAGLPYYTMPFVDGSSLRTRLAEGPLSIGEVTGVLKEVARALAYAHEHGVVHRDIKPDNVLLSRGSATVTDFGIAKALSAARTASGGATLTQAGTSIGTPAYVAPEQAAGDPDTDHRSDIYSFGCMAYELLAGRPPFTGPSAARLLGAHLGETPKDVREFRADAPEPLATAVMQCLAKDPDARPQQANDLVHALDTVTSSGAGTVVPGILAERIHIGKALAIWAAASALVVLMAWAATVVIGLPDWVLPGASGVVLAGLPIIGLTAWVQRVAQKANAATPTYTPGGTAATTHGTLHTIAIKAGPHLSWKRTWFGGAIAVGGFVALVVGYMVLRALGIGPAGTLLGAGKLSENERIIISDFRSPANDSSLGVTITEALRADLAQSSILRTVPRVTIANALRQMDRPPDSPIDFDLARTIATREGVKAVLDGDVVEAGGRYVLSAQFISADGEQLATFREEARNEADLIPAIGRLARQLREKAGESFRDLRKARSLDRVTTESLAALREYAASIVISEQTSNLARSIPRLEEAVRIDSTFAMAWRRLANLYSFLGRPDKARTAATQGYRYASRLGELERQVVIATYHHAGPEVDHERALAAYEAVIALDSVYEIALNNAALLLWRRRAFEQAMEYSQRAHRQYPASATLAAVAVQSAIFLRRWDLADSILQAAALELPANLLIRTLAAIIMAARADFDEAERVVTEVAESVSSPGAGTAAVVTLGMQAALADIQGRVRQADSLFAELRTRADTLNPGARYAAGIDHEVGRALVRGDSALARRLLDQAIRGGSIDSIPALDGDYDRYLAAAAFVQDAAMARRSHTDAARALEASGRPFHRPAQESLNDGALAFAEGRYEDARAKVEEADRRRLPDRNLIGFWRFMVLDRLQLVDETVAAGEAYLSLPMASIRNGLGINAVAFPSVRQRLGELYEQKGNVEKALEHYSAFVELWKDADPELQPRVRDVRGRIQRLQRQGG